jgi:hypothetical protein
MTQPVPEYPTNVQASNPYVGIDRGLFMIQGPVPTFGRVHAARWESHGPNAGIGRLEYQIMVFSSMPVTPAQFMGGTLATAPDGTKWFDCLVRGSLLPPIMVEYWARHTYLGYFANHEVADAVHLSALEKSTAVEQAQALTVTMGRPLELDTIEFVVTYNQSLGSPLTRSTATLTIGYGPANSKQELTLTSFSQEFFDPVQYALAHLKSLRS